MRITVRWVMLISSMAAFHFGSSLAAEKPCDVSLPQNVDESSCCHDVRHQDILKNQMAYRLVTKTAVSFPLVDLTEDQFEKILAIEPFMRPYAERYKKMTEAVLYRFITYLLKELASSRKYDAWLSELRDTRDQKLKNMDLEALNRLQMAILRKLVNTVIEFLKPLKSFEEYEELRDFFFEGLNVEQADPLTPMEDLMSDEYFSQQRVAGANPMSLEAVNTNIYSKGDGVDWCDLKMSLNSRMQEITLDLIGKKLQLFVVRYPLCNPLPKGSDFNPLRDVVSTQCPIALFVLDSQMKGKLKPVAIQMEESTPDSDVYTPDDKPKHWMVAKLNVQTIDLFYSQVVEHLAKCHFVSEAICVSMKRHLPDLHPLQQMMKYHCREVMVPNMFGAPALLNPVTGFLQLLFVAGSKGAEQLLERAQGNITWDITDFRGNIQKRGLAKYPEYFPYRDDGEEIYGAIEKMVNEYVQLYYTSDGDVTGDKELQAFANEVSVEGTDKPDGGDGKLKGFPKSIETVVDLQEILTRIIWQLTGQHASVNYELIDFAAFVPNMPSKTFKKRIIDKIPLEILPNKFTATVQVVLSMSLATLRVDKLFDYGSELSDPQARQIVTDSFNLLNDKVTETLNARNSNRSAAGQLTYPYMLPEKLPNGIQT